MKHKKYGLNQTWPVGRKWCPFQNVSQKFRVLPQDLGRKKHQILDHFFRDFSTRHRISPEWNVTWTNKNASVNLQCVPYKVIYFPWPLTQKRLRSVWLLWRNIRRPVRCSHQSCNFSSLIYIFYFEGARLVIPDKLLKPTFPPSPYIALTPHTPINSPPLPGWRIGPIQKVSALGSRVGWTPARKERTN